MISCLLACSRPLAVFSCSLSSRCMHPCSRRGRPNSLPHPGACMSQSCRPLVVSYRYYGLPLAVLSEGRGCYQSHDVVCLFCPMRQNVNIKPRINTSSVGIEKNNNSSKKRNQNCSNPKIQRQSKMLLLFQLHANLSSRLFNPEIHVHILSPFFKALQMSGLFHNHE